MINNIDKKILIDLFESEYYNITDCENICTCSETSFSFYIKRESHFQTNSVHSIGIYKNSENLFFISFDLDIKTEITLTEFEYLKNIVKEKFSSVLESRKRVRMRSQLADLSVIIHQKNEREKRKLILEKHKQW